MNFFGDVQNSAPSTDDVRVGEIRFLSRRFCVNPNDIEKIVHDSLELFYLLKRRRGSRKGCHRKPSFIEFTDDRLARLSAFDISLISNHEHLHSLEVRMGI